MIVNSLNLTLNYHGWEMHNCYSIIPSNRVICDSQPLKTKYIKYYSTISEAAGVESLSAILYGFNPAGGRYHEAIQGLSIEYFKRNCVRSFDGGFAG